MPDDFDLDELRARQAEARAEATQLDAPDDIWAAEQRARAVVSCGMCDDDGYRGVYVCDHVDHSATSQRGSALVREALAAAKAKRETK
jgi:hypothetical protein